MHCCEIKYLLLLFTALFIINSAKVQGATKPNFVLIFADDVGYGDFQSYGHPTQEKGPIDEMAEEGMRFTNWYSADSMCSPSRSALLTGRLPIRIGVVGPNRVFWQWDAAGLPKDETTIAEALLELDYSTGMLGKWHLGINEKVVNDGGHLPVHHGFQYVGTNYPYGQNWRCDPEKFTVEEMSVKCFKYQNDIMVQQPIDLSNSTAELANDAKNFIQQNKDQPFFLYFSLLQTHCSLFCANEFCGKSKRGLYGDNINEMSWAVGEILNSLRENNIDDNTLVLFISDNGPQIEMCTDGGSAGFLKGGKGSTWEGGIRMPAFAWWPGTVPAGVVNDEVVSSLDVYSTIMELAGQTTSDDVTRDSRSIVGVLKNEHPSPHEFLFHYCSDRLMAVRYGSFKFHFFTQELADLTDFCPEGIPTDNRLTFLQCYGDSVTHQDPPLIFNIHKDPGEDHPLDSSKHRSMLAKVYAAVEEHEATIVHVDSLLGFKDESLQPCCNPPTCSCNYEPSSSSKSEL